MLSDVSSFFSVINKQENTVDIWERRVLYVLASEFYYTLKEIEELEIPFILMLLDEREKEIKNQEKELKKSKNAKFR